METKGTLTHSREDASGVEQGRRFTAITHPPRAASLAKLSRMLGTQLQDQSCYSSPTQTLDAARWHSSLEKASMFLDCGRIVPERLGTAQGVGPRCDTPIERATTPRATSLTPAEYPESVRRTVECSPTTRQSESSSSRDNEDGPRRPLPFQESPTGLLSSPQASISSMISLSSSSTSSARVSASSSDASVLQPSEGLRGESKRFPCYRADKCTSSILDETLSKYENNKYGGRLRGHSWRTRRITVNSMLANEEEDGSSEGRYCLHSFKSSDLSCREKERLVLDSGSYVAVAESGREWSAGEWVIKLSGTILSQDSSSKSAKRPSGIRSQHGSWLLQYNSRERMQVWMRTLQSLLAFIVKAEQFFRRGSQVPVELYSPAYSPSLSPASLSTPPSQDCLSYSSSQPYHVVEEDSLEELVSSTESLLVLRPRTTYACPTQALSSASSMSATSATRAPLPNRSVTVQQPHQSPPQAVFQQRSRPQSQASSFSLLPIHTLAAFPSPPSPSRGPNKAKPVLSLRMPPLQERLEEHSRQGSSEYHDGSLQSSSYCSSVSPTALSASTRSSLSPHSSLSPPYLSPMLSPQKKQGATTYSKRNPGLTLEKQSLKVPLAGKNSNTLRPLDSPTDPDIIPTVNSEPDAVSMFTSSSEYSQESLTEDGPERSASLSTPGFDKPIPLPSWCSHIDEALLNASLSFSS